MNSVASTVKALDGRATPKVRPAPVDQESKVMPVPASVSFVGVLLCADVKGKTKTV
jgi:hypothetical protein